ncbi:MAG: PD-(D/E)XK nuclease family protein, partial [Gammaproteobacteria bacterium]
MSMQITQITQIQELLFFLKNKPETTQVISSNIRLADSLNQKYKKYTGQELRKKILALQSWVDAIWHARSEQNQGPDSHSLHGFHIKGRFLQHFWKEIIQKHSDSPILRPDDLAELCIESDTWASLWDIKTWEAETQEHKVFLDWRLQLEKQLNTKHLFRTQSILKQLYQILETSPTLRPKLIILVGFYEQSPFWLNFWKSCVSLGIEVKAINFTTRPEAIAIQPCVDFQTERKIVGQWLAQELESQKAPGQLGLVVPDLQLSRALWADSLLEVLPETAVNIAAPPNLLSYHLIRAAYDLLQILSQDFLELADLFRLLKRPYWQGSCLMAEDYWVFEIFLRKQHYESYKILDLEMLFQKFQEAKAKALPELKALIKNWIEFKKKILELKRLEIKDWLILVQNFLKTCGWPKPTKLSSLEYQLHFSWNKVLIEYSEWSPFLGKISYKQLLSNLGKLIQDQTFLPEHAEPKIQVLGLLEATGLPFYKLWISGMDENTWPKSPKANPFIPYAIQKKYGLPRSSADREYSVAEKITNLLVQGAKTVRISHVSRTPEGIHQGLSPLIRNLAFDKQIFSEVNTGFSNLEQKIEPKIIFESYEDKMGLPYQQDTLPSVRILQAQLECPFKGYAAGRLNPLILKQDPKAQRAMLRGVFLHRALWHFSKNGQNIAHALEQLRLEYQGKKFWKEPILSLELSRMQKILEAWSEYEVYFKAFSNSGLEYKINGHWQGKGHEKRIELRVDRLLENQGRKIILDYKSGMISKNWYQNTELDELQLAIYGILIEGVEGLLLASLKPGLMGLSGLVSEDLNLAPILKIGVCKAQEFQSKLKTWSVYIDQIILGYIQGDAKIQPKKGPQTC